MASVSLLALVLFCSPPFQPPRLGQTGARFGWEIFTRITTHRTAATGGGEGIHVAAFNVGAATSGLATITDTLPAGASGERHHRGWGICYINGEFGSAAVVGSGECGGIVHNGYVYGERCCSRIYGGSFDPGKSCWCGGRERGAENHATVTGGGALGPASQSKVVKFGWTPPGFGFAGFDGWFTNADGTPATAGRDRIPTS